VGTETSSIFTPSSVHHVMRTSGGRTTRNLDFVTGWR